MLFDLDHFKNINDSLGHPVANQMLIVFYHYLQSHFRQSDIIGHLGVTNLLSFCLMLSIRNY